MNRQKGRTESKKRGEKASLPSALARGEQCIDFPFLGFAGSGEKEEEGRWTKRKRMERELSCGDLERTMENYVDQDLHFFTLKNVKKDLQQIRKTKSKPRSHDTNRSSTVACVRDEQVTFQVHLAMHDTIYHAPSLSLCFRSGTLCTCVCAFSGTVVIFCVT